MSRNLEIEDRLALALAKRRGVKITDLAKFKLGEEFQFYLRRCLIDEQGNPRQPAKLNSLIDDEAGTASATCFAVPLGCVPVPAPVVANHVYTDAAGRTFKDDPRKLFGREKLDLIRQHDAAVAAAKAAAASKTDKT